MPSDLATKARRIRLALGLEKTHIADELDITPRAYADLERGLYQFKFGHHEKLAAFCKVSTGQLIDTPEDEIVLLVLQKRGGGAKT